MTADRKAKLLIAAGCQVKPGGKFCVSGCGTGPCPSAQGKHKKAELRFPVGSVPGKVPCKRGLSGCEPCAAAKEV